MHCPLWPAHDNFEFYHFLFRQLSFTREIFCALHWATKLFNAVTILFATWLVHSSLLILIASPYTARSKTRNTRKSEILLEASGMEIHKQSNRAFVEIEDLIFEGMRIPRFPRFRFRMRVKIENAGNVETFNNQFYLLIWWQERYIMSY